MTAVSPERALYDTLADLWADGIIGSPSIPWEEATRDERDGWARARQAALEASPELAEANATIDGLRELLAEIIGEFSEGEFSALLDTHWRKAVVRPDVVAKWHKRAGLAP